MSRSFLYPVRDLTLSAKSVAVWRGERCLCRNLSFDLHGGEALHIRGENGAGKTSLIRVLTGLGRCDEGEVLWQGRALRRCGPEYRAKLAYVGHNNGVKLGLSPRENLLAAAALGESSGHAQLEAALDQVRLEEYADTPCSSLSMGQRRRVALARLLLARVPLWFLDEPLASLDAEGVQWLAGLIKSHLGGGGLVVFVTHQPLDLTPFAALPVILGAHA